MSREDTVLKIYQYAPVEVSKRGNNMEMLKEKRYFNCIFHLVSPIRSIEVKMERNKYGSVETGR